MSNTYWKSPIGTLKGTFIINTSLDEIIGNFNIIEYYNLLKKSIYYGLNWIDTYLIDNPDYILISIYRYKKNILDHEFNDYILSFCRKWKNIIKSNVLYYNLIPKNFLHILPDITPNLDLNNYINSIKKNTQHIIQTPQYKELKCGEDKLNLMDIKLDNIYMVQYLPGKYELFVLVKHKDHYDYYPYKIINKNIPYLNELIKNLPVSV